MGSPERHRQPARATRLRAVPAGLAILTACSAPPGAGRELGDDLGGFHVAATELANGCGAGALGSSGSFDFEIDLARGSTQLFWGREASGPLDARLGFDFSATVRVPVSPSRGMSMGCTIGRADQITGTLRAGADGEVIGFSARMTYAFESAPDSSCSLDERIAAGVPRLPCAMEYALEAERTRSPD